MKPTNIELRDLYESQRLSTREIGRRLGVCKTTILKWLRGYRIPLRSCGVGLANRGIEPPSRDELERMVHEEHLGYREIAAKYGVDYTAIPNWLKRYGIKLPRVWETRNKKAWPLDEGQVRDLHAEGLPAWAIGERLGLS